ncbi:hypothetical protein B0H13DRAFT_2111782 [Mycena leptocephala]|nr:hypothetical protein B0H13DRAFT_2111782 [Mycena leptocephala]
MAAYASYSSLHPPSESSQLSPLRLSAPTEKPTFITPQRAGIGIWTPLCILGGTTFAAILAILHHFFDSYLNNRLVTGYWTQSKSNQIEIFLATAFKIAFNFSAGVSLCQISWHSMRRQPLPLGDINALLKEPSIMTLPRLNILFQAPASLAITAAILISSLITIFAPSLTVRQGSAEIRTIAVPTLNMTTDALLGDFSVQHFGYGPVTSTWDKAALMGLLAENPLGWTIPDGCSPECEYNITYTAPALRCSDLAPDQIDDELGLEPTHRYVPRVFQNPPSAYLQAYDGYLTSGSAGLNFTAQDDWVPGSSDTYGLTLAYVPYVASNANDGALINAAGSLCTFYNATHQLYTHFVNSTQETRVSVIEFLNPLNTTYKAGESFMNYFHENGSPDGPDAGVEGVSFAPGIGAQAHLLAMADAFTQHLTGEIWRDGHTGVLTSTTSLTETNLMPPFVSPSLETQFPGLNMSSSISNISQALQDLVANATTSFMHLNTGFTTVSASVPSTENVYHYNHTTLAATYLSFFVILLLISALGMYCLITNGEPSSNDFSHLLVATRNPNWTHAAGRTRLMFGEIDVPQRGVKAAFGLVSEQNVELLRRRGLKTG